MPEAAPITIGRYAIDRLLGRGAMGAVYLAYDPRLRRHVALKVLGADAAAAGVDVVAAALREARAAGAVVHPNAAAVYDADDADGQAYIVMEYVPGTLLRRFVGDASIPLPVRVRWLVDAAGAVAAAHAVGVVHRDVKPENVMVREDGVVKVLDFGVAHTPAHEGDVFSTWAQGGGFIGTPGYMAPEVLRGRDVDGRADQFAWGVLAYELLTGATPWKRRETAFALIAAVLTEQPDPLAPEVPREIAAVVERTLAKDPADRFASLAEVAAAMAPFAAPATQSFQPPPESLVRLAAPSTPRASALPPLSAPRSQRSDTLAVPTPPPHTRTAPAAPPRAPLETLPSESERAGAAPPAALETGAPSARPPRQGSSRPLPSVRAPRPSSPSLSEPAAPPSGRPSRPPASGRISSLPSTPPPTVASPRVAGPPPLLAFRAPDLSAPVDVAAHIAALPLGAACKGMFFSDLLSLASKLHTPRELSLLAGIEDRRYVPFRDYPMADNLRLTVAVANAVHPRLPLGEALHLLGQRALGTFLESHIGRTLFGIFGRDPEPFLLHAPRAYRVVFGFGRVEAEKAGPVEYVVRARALPLFLETYQMGVLASVLERCRAQAEIDVRTNGIANADVRVRLR